MQLQKGSKRLTHLTAEPIIVRPSGNNVFCGVDDPDPQPPLGDDISFPSPCATVPMLVIIHRFVKISAQRMHACNVCTSRLVSRLAEASRVEERHAVVRHQVGLPGRAVEERLEGLEPPRELLVLHGDGLVALLQLLDILGRLCQHGALPLLAAARAGGEEQVCTHFAHFGCPLVG